MKVEKNLPMLDLRAAFAPETLDKEARTIELVWTTGAKVLRRRFFDDDFYEELSLDPASVRMGRMENGAPLLNTHDSSELEDVIGVVEKAWLTPTEGRALVRFSERDSVAPIFQDVMSGIIRNVSVGYAVYKYQDVSLPDDSVRTFRAIDWEPMEISLVPMGADASAGVRNSEKTTRCEVILRAENLNPKEDIVEPKENSAGAPKETPVDIEAVRKESVLKERTRTAEIFEAVRAAKLGDAKALEFVQSEKSADDVRKEVLTILAAKSEETEVRTQNPSVTITRDEGDTMKRGIESALLHRSDAGKYKLAEEGRDYRSMSLLDLAKEVLEKRGTRVRGMDKMEIAQRALLTTSDFKNILGNVIHKRLRDAYLQAPQTWKPLVTITEASDFKPMSVVKLAGSLDLTLVPEGGEFTLAKLSDSGETYKLATYGKIIPISRQVIVNDDLGAMLRLAVKYGQAASSLESNLAWGQITGNPTMGADNTAVFHANHKNLGTSGVISLTTIGEFRKLMRQQKEGSEFINLSMKYLIVPTALETVADQFVSQNLLANQAGSVNPFAGRLTVIAEPRLDAVSAAVFYGAAGSDQIDTIEMAYLQGQQGVFIEEAVETKIDGVAWKARLDVASKVIDYKGLVRNAGV